MQQTYQKSIREDFVTSFLIRLKNIRRDNSPLTFLVKLHSFPLPFNFRIAGILQTQKVEIFFGELNKFDYQRTVDRAYFCV